MEASAIQSSASSAPLQAADLAELMRAFSEVTERLEATHQGLQSEVSRLRAELGEANVQLERSKRLSALGEMAAGIAHEIRNPLGAIGLYARLLEQDLAECPLAHAREMAGRIRQSVMGLDAIVSDVLDFSRDLRVQASEVEADELLERALETCCPGGVMPEGVRLSRHGVCRSVRVKCDAGLVHQALVNVIRNALEAMAEKAVGRPQESDGAHGVQVLTLGVERRTSRLSFGELEDRVALIVQDTGGGVPEDVRDRMFNPFFTTRRAGTGLGLAIVHRIVDAHGGVIRVHSVVDDSGRAGARIELVFHAAEGVKGAHLGDEGATGFETGTEPAVMRVGFARRHVA